jgi:hypothetical protein
MAKYIDEGRKEPIVITTARKIAEISAGTARSLGRDVTDETRQLIQLEGIHAWTRERWEYVKDPAGIELIKTPSRMLRELDIPEALSTAMWEPIREAMAARLKKDPAALSLPIPKVTGDSDEAVVLVLALAAALDIGPLKMRLGGTEGVIHYVWGAAYAAGEWRDCDILHPEFGKHHPFDIIEEMEIPIADR